MTTPPYWLDANVFIEASNGLYDFDLVPSFWVWLEHQLKAGVLCSSSLVYDEILGKDDRLARWTKVRKGPAYWPEPEPDVQAAYRDIADYVETQYPNSPAKVADFLRKADCWIIAHAKARGGTVVTLELKVNTASQTPKVPNVCEAFDVPHIDTRGLLKELKLRL